MGTYVRVIFFFIYFLLQWMGGFLLKDFSSTRRSLLKFFSSTEVSVKDFVIHQEVSVKGFFIHKEVSVKGFSSTRVSL